MFGDNTVLCLDWDRRNFRFVRARVSTRAIKLEKAHSVRIRPQVDPDDPAAMGEFIAQTLTQFGVKQRKVIVDVPRDKAVINRLKIAPTPAPELAAVVRFQALRELPFPLDDAHLDFAVLERDANRNAIEVLLAAVRNETLARLKETCAAAGLTLARVGLRPCANLVSVLNLPAMMDRRVLFVDVGPSVTEIDVFRGETLAFSRAASVAVPFQGGSLMTDDSVVSSKAEIAKLERADEFESQAVEDLLVEITRSLQAYRAAETSATIDQIIVAGGTGIENSLLAAVDERFGLPATLFDPTMSLGENESEAAKLRSFSAALGLAWGAGRPERLAIDFLNPKKSIPRKVTLKKRAQRLATAAAVVLGGCVAYAAWDYFTISSEVAALRKQNEEPSRKARARRELELRVGAANDWAREAEKKMWLNHLLLITQQACEAAGREKEHPTKKMLVTSLTCNADDPKNATITIKLMCDNDETAMALAKAIADQRVNGKPIYGATAGKFTEAKVGDTKFRGTMQIDVKLLDLQAYAAGAKDRDAKYRDASNKPL